MERPTCEHSPYYTHKPHKQLNSTKSKMKEARVVDFSGIERKEGVNRVSKLSKSFANFLRLPSPAFTKRAVEATGNKRRQAHGQVLRKIKKDIEGLRNHEKVERHSEQRSSS
jgi:hypothetical protein